MPQKEATARIGLEHGNTAPETQHGKREFYDAGKSVRL
jgi:hypothetical protein